MIRKKALYNIIISTTLRVLVLIFGIISRRYLINILGDEATGLFSLFTSIIGFLSIAELGIGTAITFSMYKPIVNNEHDTVSALYFLYKKIYHYILVIILFIGVGITPLIPYFADGNTGLYNIYNTYLLFLSSTLITYLYAHKTSYINAQMDNYITSIIRSSGVILESILQVIIIIKFKSFNLFLMSIIFSNILQWLSTNIIFKIKYLKGINGNKEISKEVKTEVIDKSKAMFMHKIGGLLVNTTNSIIIGAFVSIVMLGRYSNYIMIVSGMTSIIALIFTSIASVIGQSYARNTKEESHKQFINAYFINFIIALVFFLGFWAVIDDLVALLFNTDIIIDRNISFLIAITYFMSFMRQAMIVYREASGTFYYDRYKPIIEGVLNLILSLVLVQFLGIAGVLIATIFTNLTICMTIEPYVLFKYGFNKSTKKYYAFNYGLTFLFAIVLILFEFIPFFENTSIINIIVKGFSSVIVSALIIALIILVNKNRRNQLFALLFKRKDR